MCDKRFMPINRSNVGENVTINRCISTLISFSAFKKDCPSSTSSVCQAGGTHKFFMMHRLDGSTYYLPKYIYIYQEYQAYQSIFQISSTHKKKPFCALTLRNNHKIKRMTSKNNPKIFLLQIIFIFDPLPTKILLKFKILNP